MRSSRVLGVVVALACLGLLSATAWAQPAGPGGPGMGQRGPGMMMGGGFDSPIALLAIEQVQKEVEVSDEQKAKITALGEKLAAEMRERFSGLREMDADARRAAMEKMRSELETQAKDLEKQVGEILLPHQLTRLKEIRIQILGNRALQDAAVIEALGITEAQRTKMREVQEGARETMQSAMEGFRELRDLSEEDRRARMTEMREKMTKSREEIEQKTLGVLSDEQRQKLEKMKGEKFELDMSQMRMRMPGGGQRPAPQQ